MDFKLPFGLKNGRLVHVSKVEKGLDCGCVCPSCNHPLVARKGNKTKHHFAHHKGKECGYGLETALHYAAKELLEKHKKIVIPKVDLKIGPHDKKHWLLSKEREITFDEVKLEFYHEGVIPDVLVYINGKPLMIEITVTHKTGKEKIQKVREQGISILEIDLAYYEREFNIEDLEKEVIYNTANKKWLLNMKSEKIRDLAYHVSERKDCVALSPPSCPVEKVEDRNQKKITWIDNCSYCVYCTGIDYDTFFTDEEYLRATVFCSGKNRIATLSDLLQFVKKNNIKLN